LVRGRELTFAPRGSIRAFFPTSPARSALCLLTGVMELAPMRFWSIPSFNRMLTSCDRSAGKGGFFRLHGTKRRLVPLHCPVGAFPASRPEKTTSPTAAPEKVDLADCPGGKRSFSDGPAREGGFAPAQPPNGPFSDYTSRKEGFSLIQCPKIATAHPEMAPSPASQTEMGTSRTT
jgi:hypothetical protein